MSGLCGEDLWCSRSGSPVLQGVTLEVGAGEVVGLQGPSGVGKSTLGRLLAGLLRPQRGTVRVDGVEVRRPGQGVQYLVQDAAAGMNERWRVEQVLAEAGPVAATESDLVDPGWWNRFPHELSGGQLQRVSLARALRARPRYLVADEITASLDALTQAEVWHQLLDLARAQGMGVLAISHDPALLGRIADRVEDLTAPPASGR